MPLSSSSARGCRRQLVHSEHLGSRAGARQTEWSLGGSVPHQPFWVNSQDLTLPLVFGVGGQHVPGGHVGKSFFPVSWGTGLLFPSVCVLQSG